MVLEYVEHRYGFRIVSDRAYRAHNTAAPGGHRWDRGDMMIRLRMQQGPAFRARPFYLFLTRISSPSGGGNCILIDRCFGCLYFSTHSIFPAEAFDDTLIEGEFDEGVFHASDVLIHRGETMYNRQHPSSFRVLALARIGILRGLLLQDQPQLQQNFRAPVWYPDIDTLYKNIFAGGECKVDPTHVTGIIIRNPKKHVDQRDVFIPMMMEEEGANLLPPPAVEKLGQEHFELELEHGRELGKELERRDFFVRATSMPDVYELFEHTASVNLCPPYAIAGILKLSHSQSMAALFKADRSLIIQCMFEFNTEVNKWVPSAK